MPELGATLDQYVAAVRGATDAQIEKARARLRAAPTPDARRRVIVVDPLEEIFAEDDADARATLFSLLGGLWSLPWCTVILCMRADFYGALMAERCWRELEINQYPVAPLDDAGLRDAIVEPARHAGVHVDAALVERLIREIDRDRSSVPLPLLQVALKELWTHLRWRYLTLADYERIVNHDDLRTQRRLEARAAGGGVLTGDELSEYTRWVAWLTTPAGQALGASEALRAIVRRSLRARRFRRGALGVGLTAATTFAIVFGLQTWQLRDEKTKTQRSIGEAAKAVQLIVFEVDGKLRTVAGASRMRETLLQQSRDLLSELRKLGNLEVNDQRTAAFGKVAQADLAFERGHPPGNAISRSRTKGSALPQCPPASSRMRTAGSTRRLRSASPSPGPTPATSAGNASSA